MRNEIRTLSESQEVALGTYVYALWDPRDRKVFYIGMGRGSRVLSHFRETEDCEPSAMMAKHRRIAEIWAEDLDVRWHVLRRNLQTETTRGEDIASHVEAAVIDALDASQNGMTLNEIRGMGAAIHGSLSEKEVAALGATLVNPTYAYAAVFLFPIHRALGEGRETYDATRREWAVSERYRNLNDALAIGITGGVSRGVYAIQEWRSYGDAGRQEFVGRELRDHPLLNKSWLTILGAAMGYWQRGNYLIVRLDGNGNFQFIRGAQDRNAWLGLT